MEGEGVGVGFIIFDFFVCQTNVGSLFGIGFQDMKRQCLQLDYPRELRWVVKACERAGQWWLWRDMCQYATDPIILWSVESEVNGIGVYVFVLGMSRFMILLMATRNPVNSPVEVGS